MKPPTLALIILALLLPGCTLPAPAGSVPECGPVVRTAAPFGEEGPLLRVYLRNEGSLEATVCIRVNENNPFSHRVSPSTASPDVALVTQGRFTERELLVSAWVAERPGVEAEGGFRLTDENHLVVTLTPENTLRVEKHDEAPPFV